MSRVESFLSRWGNEPKDAGRLLGSVLMPLGVAVVVAVFLADVVTPGDDVFDPLEGIPIVLAAWLTDTAYRWMLGLAIGLGVVSTRLGGITVMSAASGALGMVGIVVVVRMARQRLKPTVTAAPRISGGPLIEGLTRREAEVVALAGRGLTAPEIGASLSISARTVESHLANAMGKLGVRSKRHLVGLFAAREDAVP